MSECKIGSAPWGSLGLGVHEHVEHLLLLGPVGAHGDGVGHDLFAGEVVDRREVGLTEGELELGDIGTHLLPGPIGCEVAADDVVEALSHGSLVGVVPVVGPLAAYAAAQPHLAHHLQDRLVSDACSFLSAQAHGYLPVTAPVRGARKDLSDLGPQMRPGHALGVSQRVVVARPGKTGHLKEIAHRMSTP